MKTFVFYARLIRFDVEQRGENINFANEKQKNLFYD